MLEKLEVCPLCGYGQSEVFITCQDYTVSNELFEIVQCKFCNFKYTNPRPTEDSIGKYYQSEAYVSHSATKKGLVNRIYHIVRSKSLSEKLQLINSVHSKGGLLDVGCGTGDFLRVCQHDGWMIAGVEVDPGAREKARINSGVTIRQSLLGESFAEKFDIITLWHVLEHIHQLHQSIAKIGELLSETGKIIVAVPNSNAWDAKKYKQHWAAYDVPRHLYHFSKDTLGKLFAKYGLKIVDTKPMIYDAYYISMLSTKYRDGTIHYLEAIKNGFLSNYQASKDGNNFSSNTYIISR